MSIYLRGSTYWYAFMVKGKTYRGSCKTSNEREAQEYHDREKSKAWRGRVVGDKEQHTVDEAINLYLKEHEHKRSYRDDERSGNWWKEQLKSAQVTLLDDITPEIIRGIRDEELERTGRTGKKITVATVNRKLAFLRSVLRAAQLEWQWLDKPIKVKLLPGEGQRERYLEPHEVERLVAALPEPFNFMALFAVSTGLRQGNVLGLKWSQVNLAQRFIRFSDKVMKNGRPFAIALNETAITCIRAQLGKHDEYVFVRDGEPMSWLPSNIWAAALKEAGLNDVRWHDLRHTWASLMRQAGIGLDDLQEMGGWESPLMVKRYAHLDVSHLAPKAAVLDSLIARRPASVQNLHSV